jgi:DNA-binding response OmpR family regulator
LKILVAEDEPELVRFYKILLEDLGYQVVTARDGQECVDAYMKSSNSGGVGGREDRGFDLVILDHKMPRMNGIDVANRIAAILPSQKLLMITAFGGVLEPARKPENMRIMAKPFDVDELVMTVKRLLGNRNTD